MSNKLGLWLLWALSNSLTIGFFPILMNVVQSPSALLIGLFLHSLPQWLLLRFYLREPGWWLLATSLGGGIALVTGSYAMFFVSPYGGAAIGGAILGFAQWLVLKRYTTKASWWILFSCIALMIGAGWVMSLSIQLETFINLDRWIKSCLASGLIGGTIKGGALVWLLQSPKKDSDRNY